MREPAFTLITAQIPLMCEDSRTPLDIFEVIRVWEFPAIPRFNGVCPGRDAGYLWLIISPRQFTGVTDKFSFIAHYSKGALVGCAAPLDL